MRPQELEKYSEDIRRKSAASEERGGRIFYEFPEELLVAAQKNNMRTGPPFAVVGSTDMDPSVGGVWPVREYPWYVHNCNPWYVHNWG